ncbi:MAG: hypothetical protein WCH34_19370, partial [Bacteroidota bacterium]
MLVWYWDKIMFHSEKGFIKNLILYVLFASLCSFNHYFSLLFAIIVSLSGLFFIRKNKLLSYVIAGFAILLLFIPYVPIFLEQFQRKGVESWLGKPHPEFIVDYFRYVFHFSYLTVGLLLAIIAWGILQPKRPKFAWRFFFISLCWFFTPFIIGYFYSVKVSALLQFSLLIFGFPFLLFALFAHIRFSRQWMIATGILLILTVNTLTLCCNRRHYSIFYQVPYEQILLETEKDFQLYGDSLTRVIDSDTNISKYYQQTNHLKATFVRSNSFSSLAEFNHFLANQRSPYLSFGCLASSDPVLIPLIMNYYPHLLRQVNVFLGTYYVFSKTEHPHDIQPFIISKSLNFAELPLSNPQPGQAFLMDSNTQFSRGFELPLAEVMQHKNNFIDITLEFYAPHALHDVAIVSQLSSHDTLIDWRSSKLNLLAQPPSSDSLQKAFLSLKLSDIYLKYPDIMLKAYVWNPAKESVLLKKLQLNTRQGNPIVYALYDRL